MGCDIHMHTERFIDGRWSYECAGPYDDRNYDLFWVLGEIDRRQGPNPPIGSYRGVPEDASDQVKTEFEGWEPDAHSASWLSLAEIERWLEQHPSQPEEDKSSFWSDDLETLRAMRSEPEHVRIVFWFDN